MATEKAVNTAQTLSREETEKLIRHFGEEAGLKGLQLDNDGAAWFTDASGNVHGLVHLENRPGLLVLAGMPAAALRSGAALDMMLRANVDPTAVAGGVFGHVPGRDEPFLMTMVPAEAADAAGLSEYLDAFFNLVAEWREELDGPEYDPAGGIENAAADRPATGQAV